jgi:hypothetical protein
LIPTIAHVSGMTQWQCTSIVFTRLPFTDTSRRGDEGDDRAAPACVPALAAACVGAAAIISQPVKTIGGTAAGC